MSNTILKVAWSVAIAGVLGATVFAGDRTAARPASRRLLLRVSAGTNIPVSALVRAHRVVLALFDHIDIDLDWIECGVDFCGQTDARPPSVSIDVNVVSLNGRALRVIPHDALAAVVNSGESREIALVLFDRVRRTADRYAFDPGVVLGHAIAHEVGHLLLPRGAHGRAGLMRARWRMEDLRDAVQGQLGFSESEAAIIRERLN